MSITKRGILPVIIFVIGVAIIAAIIMSKPKPKPSSADTDISNIQVNVIELKRETSRLSVNSQGTVTPRREIDLTAQVSGQVIAVEDNFRNGGFFSKGSTLIQIDDSDYQTALLNAKSRLATAQSTLAQEKGRARQAKREWRDLGDQGANDLFLRKPHVLAAQAAVASAQGDVQAAELNLQRTRISVPFDGRVRKTMVDLGQFVSRGTALATVYDTASAEVRLPLSDKQAALVHLPLGFATDQAKAPAKVILKGSIAGKEYQWDAMITRTDSFVDVDSRMLFAVAEVKTESLPTVDIGENTTEVTASETSSLTAPLLPGLFVEAKIEGKAINDVIILPINTVFKRDQIYFLNEDNQVQIHQVNVLHKNQQAIWITADIPEQTRIILNKQSLLLPGVEVDPIIDNSFSLTTEDSATDSLQDVSSSPSTTLINASKGDG